MRARPLRNNLFVFLAAGALVSCGGPDRPPGAASQPSGSAAGSPAVGPQRIKVAPAPEATPLPAFFHTDAEEDFALSFFEAEQGKIVLVYQPGTEWSAWLVPEQGDITPEPRFLKGLRRAELLDYTGVWPRPGVSLTIDVRDEDSYDVYRWTGSVWQKDGPTRHDRMVRPDLQKHKARFADGAVLEGSGLTGQMDPMPIYIFRWADGRSAPLPASTQDQAPCFQRVAPLRGLAASPQGALFALGGRCEAAHWPGMAPAEYSLERWPRLTEPSTVFDLPEDFLPQGAMPHDCKAGLVAKSQSDVWISVECHVSDAKSNKGLRVWHFDGAAFARAPVPEDCGGERLFVRGGGLDAWCYHSDYPLIRVDLTSAGPRVVSYWFAAEKSSGDVLHPREVRLGPDGSLWVGHENGFVDVQNAPSGPWTRFRLAGENGLTPETVRDFEWIGPQHLTAPYGLVSLAGAPLDGESARRRLVIQATERSQNDARGQALFALSPRPKPVSIKTARPINKGK